MQYRSFVNMEKMGLEFFILLFAAKKKNLPLQALELPANQSFCLGLTKTVRT